MLDLKTISPTSIRAGDGLQRYFSENETSSVRLTSERPQKLEGVEKSTQTYIMGSENVSLEERLFDALASAKITTATFAMHLPRNWRDRFFERLDLMHEPSDWEDEDSTLQPSSVSTFLRAWLSWNPSVNPGFGISMRGNLISAWAIGDRRLTVEYLPKDLLSWLVMIPHREEDWVERGSGISKLDELRRKIQPYGADEWMYAPTAKDHTASK